MPAESPGFLTLFYVGVVPMMQGQGYVNDLLSAGTATLLKTRSKHDKPLIADTDVSNAPMAAAFERAGWARFAGRQEYVISLSALQQVSFLGAERSEDWWLVALGLEACARPSNKLKCLQAEMLTC